MSPRSPQEVPKCTQDRPKRRQDKHKIQRSRLQSVCNQAGCQDAQKWVPRIAEDVPKKVPRRPQGAGGGGCGGDHDHDDGDDDAADDDDHDAAAAADDDGKNKLFGVHAQVSLFYLWLC